MSMRFIILGLFLIVPAAFSQQSGRVDLGHMQNGATVSFVRDADGGWGIEISGGTAPSLIQQKPVQLEVFQSEADIIELAAR